MKITILGAALGISVGLAAAQTVRTQFDQEMDFKQYHTYQWREHPLIAKHPEVRQYTVGAQLVQSDVNENLMRRSYVPVEEKPDMFVTFFVTARGGQEVTSVPATSFYSGYYMWPYSWYAWSPTWFSGWETEVRNYVEGILILDFVDAKTNKLVWRAICKDKIDDMKNRHKNIQKTVEKALKKFPPKV
ncbi:MAG: DUF4136 domain-containing protein [Bryobacterales bacterium]|nr:DUF4136 domain-containing protein [Bryobacterales bacterium]